MKSASAVAYAEALGCGRTDAVRRLRDLGVDTLLKKPRADNLMAMVRLSQVTRAMGVSRDPLSVTPGGWTAFWSAFGQHLAASGSVFRLVRIANGPAGRLRSGDRRTVATIDMAVDGRVVVRLEAGREAPDPTRAERGGFTLRNQAS